jgi:hypothetical protein
VVGLSMNDDLEGIWKEEVVSESIDYSGIFKEGLKPENFN